MVTSSIWKNVPIIVDLRFSWCSGQSFRMIPSDNTYPYQNNRYIVQLLCLFCDAISCRYFVTFSRWGTKAKTCSILKNVLIIVISFKKSHSLLFKKDAWGDTTPKFLPHNVCVENTTGLHMWFFHTSFLITCLENIWKKTIQHLLRKPTLTQMYP